MARVLVVEDEREVLRSLREVLEQEGYDVTTAGVLHRDVKAANVVVGADGQAVLLDLGVVRPLNAAKMTATGDFLGTLHSAAPEWLVAESCTAASDVYSLGTIAYHLLSGAGIFAEVKPWARVVEAVRSTPPAMNQDGWDDSRRELGELALRMLEKQPEARPALDDVLRMLERS
jgi:serine/threonine-protein kinase